MTSWLVKHYFGNLPIKAEGDLTDWSVPSLPNHAQVNLIRLCNVQKSFWCPLKVLGNPLKVSLHYIDEACSNYISHIKSEIWKVNFKMSRENTTHTSMCIYTSVVGHDLLLWITVVILHITDSTAHHWLWEYNKVIQICNYSKYKCNKENH